MTYLFIVIFSFGFGLLIGANLMLKKNLCGNNYIYRKYKELKRQHDSLSKEFVKLYELDN